jgi:hypothetical protein
MRTFGKVVVRGWRVFKSWFGRRPAGRNALRSHGAASRTRTAVNSTLARRLRSEERRQQPAEARN